MSLDEVGQVKRAGKACRYGPDDEDIGFELLALHGHGAILANCPNVDRYDLRGLGFFELVGEGGDDFEDVGDDGVVGDFEDGGVFVFVDGDDGARSLHADNVLDGSTDAEGEIEFWRDGLARAANLAVHGKPALVADGARGGDFAADGLSRLLGKRDILGSFDAASDGHNDGRLREVHGLLGLAEKFERLGANLPGLQIHGGLGDGGFSGSVRRNQIGAEGAGLERGKPRRGTLKRDISDGLGLQQLTYKNQ